MNNFKIFQAINKKVIIRFNGLSWSIVAKISTKFRIGKLLFPKMKHKGSHINIFEMIFLDSNYSLYEVGLENNLFKFHLLFSHQVVLILSSWTNSINYYLFINWVSLSTLYLYYWSFYVLIESYRWRNIYNLLTKFRYNLNEIINIVTK